jgi:hypothetical protein
MANQLLGTSFDDGLKMPYFVNGRLLTASDLHAEQDATLARLGYLGKAAGCGVVEGLLVSPAAGANRLRISGGLGVTRSGHTVRLGDKGVEISLLLTPEGVQIGEDAGRFQECGLAGAPQDLSAGAYLLTVRPVSRLEGSAPVKTLRGNVAVCESKWEVDGVEFCAIPLPNFKDPTGVQQRNLLAHWCFGSQGLERLALDPFSFRLADYLNLHPLNVAGLTECDLPLAVFTWTGTGLDILDNWPARRRMTHTYPGTAWDAALSDVRVAEGQARFLQFQEQLEYVQATDKPPQVPAGKYFRYLPPVGYLPIILPRQLLALLAAEATQGLVTALKGTKMVQTMVVGGQVSSDDVQAFVNAITVKTVAAIVKQATGLYNSTGAFDLSVFFADALPEQIGLVERETVEFTLNRAWYDEAIDLQRPTPFHIYVVKEPIQRTLRALLFLSLDGPEFRRSVVLEVEQKGGAGALREAWMQLWDEDSLREFVYRAIATDPTAAVQEVTERNVLQPYAMFVKDIASVQWVHLRGNDK